MKDTIKDFVKFLHMGARLDLKTIALSHILGLTASREGIDILVDNSELLRSLLSLLGDPNETVSKDSSLSLVNISADDDGAKALLNLKLESSNSLVLAAPDNIIKTALRFILDPDSHIADSCCMILSNISRSSQHVDKVVDLIDKAGIGFDSLVNVFTKTKHNQNGANLHYLGPVFSNLSQSVAVRRYLLDRNKYVIQRLIAFTEYKESSIRRGGVVGTLRNCCFETEFHSWLLSEDVDILPKLLLPLADGTECDEEENEKLPPELQFLPENKVRENDPDIRCMLLEAITQLCSKRVNRVYVRERNTYVILRELHKWETDKKARLACENLVDILIRTEAEIGEDDLRQVDVPEDLKEDFLKQNEALLKE